MDARNTPAFLACIKGHGAPKCARDRVVIADGARGYGSTIHKERSARNAPAFLASTTGKGAPPKYARDRVGASDITSKEPMQGMHVSEGLFHQPTPEAWETVKRNARGARNPEVQLA